VTTDAGGDAVEVTVDGLDALYAVITLFSCKAARSPALRRIGPFLKRL
jgi:hypothetical protein